MRIKTSQCAPALAPNRQTVRQEGTKEASKLLSIYRSILSIYCTTTVWGIVFWVSQKYLVSISGWMCPQSANHISFKRESILLSLQGWAAFAKLAFKRSLLIRHPLPVNYVQPTTLCVSSAFFFAFNPTLLLLTHVNVCCWCFQGVTLDGFGCIRCPSGLSDEGHCRCPEGQILGGSLSHQEKDFSRMHRTLTK